MNARGVAILGPLNIRTEAAMRFSGKTALVTGGASGIGRCAVEQFSREGANVVIADRDATAAAQVADAIRAGGGEALTVEVDVSNEPSVEAMITAAIAQFGRIDAAMNNAGISRAPQPFTELSVENWQQMIDVNLTGVFLCMKHEIKAMLEQEPIDGVRGALCATASGAARIPAPGQPHYTAAKHGMLGLVKIAAQEFIPQGIRSNAILPGSTDTPMLTEGNPKEFVDMLRRFSPGGQLGKAADVAAAGVWLCSAEAKWVNGQSIAVDGGGVMI